MPSVLALVSKGIFDGTYKGSSIGDVIPIDQYKSIHKALAPVLQGGDLYLVTVRDNDQLWLIGVLRQPVLTETGYVASLNRVAVTHMDHLKPVLMFTSGKGMSTEVGKLGMSLQTPRVLTAADVAALEACIGSSVGAGPATTPGAPDTRTGNLAPPAERSSAANAAKKKKKKKEQDETAATTATTTAATATTATTPSSSARAPGVAAAAVWDPIKNEWVDCPTDADGLRHGELRRWRADGSLRDRVPLVRGRPHGVSEGFHPDGSVAERVRWIDGHQADATFFLRHDGSTDVPRMEAYGRNVVRCESKSDGFALVSSQNFDADGVAVSQEGLPTAPLPNGVDPDALWLSPREGLPRGGFLHGRFLPQPGTPSIGEHRLWDVDGTPIFTKVYDRSGRLLVTVLPGKPDPRDVAIEAFFASRSPASDWDTCYALAKLWSPELDARCRQRLVDASDEHWYAYIKDVLKHLEYKDDWGPKVDILVAHGLIEAFRQRQSTTPWAKKIEGLPSADLLRFLGRNDESDVFFYDVDHRVFVITKGQSEAQVTPLEVAFSNQAVTRSLRPYSGCDDRRLYFKGKHIFWVYQRYQTSLYLIGSQFFADRDQSEITLQAVVRCPDMAWAKRVEKAFLASLPSGMKTTGNDPFFSEERGAVFIRQYDGDGDGDGPGGSRGVLGNAVLNGSNLPGVMRLKMERGEATGPSVESEHASHEEAVAAFDAHEMDSLHAGATIGRIEPLVVKTPKPTAKAAPKPVVRSDAVAVEDSCAPALVTARAALAAGDRAGAVSRLVAAWRARPLSQVAGLIDWLCRNQTTEHRLSGNSKASKQAWSDAFEADDPLMSHLVTKFLPTVQIDLGVERVEALFARETDPRTEAVAAGWICRPPYTSTSSQKFFNRVFQRLATCKDGRQLARLQQRLQQLPDRDDGTMDSWMRQRLVTLLEKTGERLQAVAALVPDDDEAAVLATFDQNDSARLAALQAVFTAPYDDAKRLAYAAAVGADDPRRQLIELQHKPKPTKAEQARIETIIECHLDKLVPFSRAINADYTVFRLGFLAECRPEWVKAGDLDDPHWSTVEVILSTDKEILLKPDLPILRCIDEGILLWSDDDDQEQLTVDELVVRPTVTELTTWEPLARLAGIERAYPNLQTLHLSKRDALDTADRLLPFKNLTTLKIDGACWNTNQLNDVTMLVILLTGSATLLQVITKIQMNQGDLLFSCQRKSADLPWNLVVTLPIPGHAPEALFIQVRHVLTAAAAVIGEARVVLASPADAPVVKKALAGVSVTWA